MPDLHGAGWRRVVSDVAQVEAFRDGQHSIKRRGGWTLLNKQRGFDAMCDHFVDAVRRGELLGAADALRTREICEQILGEAAGRV